MKLKFSLWWSVPPLLGFKLLWTDCLQFLEFFCSLFFCCLYYSKWPVILSMLFHFYNLLVYLYLQPINYNCFVFLYNWWCMNLINLYFSDNYVKFKQIYAVRHVQPYLFLYENNLSRPWYSLFMIPNISSGLSLQPPCSHNLMILIIPLLKIPYDKQ